ncbi:MAG: S-layer homology domain-containing protein, partial [Oscillospiraceae bacterium]|nr:S-layer homology domain-containing protein [Oscillospiraceae bacterium]
MKRKLAAFLCALVLLSSVSAAATGGLGAVFSRSRGYSGAFSDLAPELWYHDYAVALYEYGFTEGRGDGTFAGTAQVTLAELLTFSARVRALYEAQGAAVEFSAAAEGEAWYAPYVAYLKGKNLLAEEFEGRYEAVATRAEMAGIFAKTLPAACYDDRNAALVTDGYALGQYILDVDDYTPYQWEILWLYKQGILNGTDERARFMPDASVTRAEVAAMLTRMVEPAARLSLEWNVLPYPSAVGARYEDFVVPPQSVNTAPAVTDKSAMDALVRDMIALGKTKITLQYPAALTAEEAETLTGTAVSVAKTYGEQMYSRVRCTAYSTGQVELTFASACCTDAQLAINRKDALAAAVAAHDALWESGYLYKSM